MTEAKSDKHVGHWLLDSLKERPNAICQIDAATGEEETNYSVRLRSVRLAHCLRLYGLAPGDVLALHGRNHLDLHIPYYAALMNGLPYVGVNAMFSIDEIKRLFKLTEPRIVFCDPGNYDIYVTVASDLGLNLKVVEFGNGENSMQEFLESYAEDSVDVEEFEPAIFNQDKVYAWLLTSSGTTGVFKVAAIKHNNIMSTIKNVLIDIFHIEGPDCPSGINKPLLNLTCNQWITGCFFAILGPLLRQTKVQTSATPSAEHVIDIINKYKPVSSNIQPVLATRIIKNKKRCDLTCFKQLVISSSKIHVDLLREFKKRVSEGTPVIELYGQTESIGPVFSPRPFGPLGNCGVPTKYCNIKLVDPETGKEITDPNVTGELWLKNEGFTEYYNDPETTATVFTEDGWYKTGDLMYRDENNHYFFVERLKMMIKYRSYNILPPKLEEVIRSHQGVLEVSVSSVPHEHDVNHVVACVVRQPGSTVSAQEIKDLVADKLPEYQQLRGGVVFLDSLPTTSTNGKIAREKLKTLVRNSKRE